MNLEVRLWTRLHEISYFSLLYRRLDCIAISLIRVNRIMCGLARRFRREPM